jgi:hypothetical protein
LTEPSSEKYLKKLFSNRTDIEDALKRLDVLTLEEAQMAAAQVLKATHTVDDTGRVRGVADIALSVDNRVASVGDQVQSIGDQVQGIGDQVQGIGDRVQDVDGKVTAAMDGAEYIFYLSSVELTRNVPKCKNATVMQQAADDADQAKRS